MTWLRLCFAWFAAILAAWGSLAAAHSTPNSQVELSVGATAVTADIIVPMGEYAFATGNPVDGSARAIALARAYLADRIAVTGPDGRAWQVALDRPEFVQIAGPPDLHATATFTPPAGVDTRAFDVEWTVLVEQLPTHFALFLVAGPDGEHTIAGAVRAGRNRISIDAGEGTLALLASAIGLGARHIATGFDHLLFLTALLLPAPLIAAGRRWSGIRTARSTLWTLARIVTAFTIGHSITLVGATLGGWRLPTAPVEIVIAVSVLVSALHAIRPIFPDREPLVAGLFGLVHGLAFATLVSDAGAGLASSAIGLLGFNLGIELVQLSVVLVLVPPLIALSRRESYPIFRTAGAAACVLASGIWIMERTSSTALLSGWSLAGSMAVVALATVFLLARGRSSLNPLWRGPDEAASVEAG